VRILHLEDVDDDAELVHDTLATLGLPVAVRRVDNRMDYEAALDSQAFDVILADHSLPDFDGTLALRLAAQRCPEVPFLFVSGSIGEEVAVELLKAGSTDYVFKEHLARLGPALQRALNEAEQRRARRRAEEALRDSHRLVQRILEATPNFIYVYDLPHRRILYAAGQVERILGHGSADLKARGDMADLFAAPSGHTLDEHFARVAAAGDRAVVEAEFQVQRADGEWRWLRTREVVFDRDARGNVREVMGISEDATERKRDEERIREQAALLDEARDAVIVRELAGRIRFWNPGAAALYGWSAEEAVGTDVWTPLSMGSGPAVGEAERATLERGQWSGELTRTTRARQDVVVESRWTLVRDPGGAPRSILVIDRDVTEHKAIQAQLLRAQRMESIGTLAGGVAHDLNNILSPVLMAADILRRRSTDPDHAKLISSIETSARRGAELVKQILTFARGVHGERVLLQPRHLLREIEQLARDTFPKTIELRLDVPPDLWNLVGDATQIHQLLLNLCLNARDAMPEGGILTIAAQNVTLDDNYARMHLDAKAGPYVTMTVSDTGMGIPVGLLERIFEPFFTTKEVGKGTGLGLSTTQAIVKDHGGFINVYSELGRGASFKVYLPASRGRAEAPEVSEDIGLPVGNGELILVVDDESPILELTRDVLLAHGYRVLTAGDGSEAVALYASSPEPIAAVITDMRMPVMDGPATIRALRRINPDVKVVTSSGLGEGAGYGMDTIRKPHTASDLLAVLAKVLRG
jgi:PAS domain S-box-containing protein